MLVIRLAWLCVLAGEMFNWKVVSYLPEGSRSCVHGVIILSSTFLLRVVGRYVNVAGSARPLRYDCDFELWYIVRPKSSLRLSAYLTRSYVRETLVWRRLNECVTNDRIAFMCSGRESQDP